MENKVGRARHEGSSFLNLPVAIAVFLLAVSTGGSVRAAPCTVPDNGTGTVDLPPAGCTYLSPDDVHVIIDGLPPGTTIRLGAQHFEFFGITRQPGGSLGGEIEDFRSVLALTLEGTGDLTGFNRSLTIQAQCQTHVAPRTPGDPVQSFATDMFMIQGQLPPGDPDFDLLRITAGTGFGMPSPGHTTLTRVGGNWNIDSFFDITYRIDFVGAPNGVVRGRSGSTTATIRMATGGGGGGVCPCFPPAGRDVMYSKLGHTLDIPGIGICAPLMSGPVIVSRGDPYVDPASGLCCIDTEMTGLNLWGVDPVCGTVHITLNPAQPSKGTICETVRGKCFPATSCFNVFIRVELVDKGIVFVNCDPIVMCCTIDRLPPYDCPYSVQNPPIKLYKEVAGRNICNPVPAVPDALIREANHRPEPPQTCPPAPLTQTSNSLAHVQMDTPLGFFDVFLEGPTTTQVGQGTPTGDIPIEIVSMDLSGQSPLGPIQMRKSPNPDRPSHGQATNCRLDDQFGDMVVDSFFDVFVELEVPSPNPRKPGDMDTLRNTAPVRVIGRGIPIVHNRPFVLNQDPQFPAPPIVNDAGEVVGRIVNVVHQLPPPPPPKCDCYPRAGIDRFRSKLVHFIDIPGIGLVRADCDGPVVVRRGDPHIDPATGLCVIDTEILSMNLTCADPLVGAISITLSPKRPSRGTVSQLKPGECFPALSCFDIFIRVELKDLGIVLVNCEPVRMCCTINSLPPFGCPYAIQNPGLALYREFDDPANPLAGVCSLPVLPPPVAFIRDANHTPQEPIPACQCFPGAGRDVMDTNLWHEIIIPGFGTCNSPMSGQVVVSRSEPFIDPLTGKCCIRTTMVSMRLTGDDPTCGPVTIELNPAKPSTGLICEKVPGTCFPADSFFDIFIRVTTPAGVLVNCEPAHMTAVISSIPPWNAFYNLDLEGLQLYRVLGAADVCSVSPRPAPAATIGKALHVPRLPCTCFTPGVDIMDSTLAHRIDVHGVGICQSPLHGVVKVERRAPFVQNPGAPAAQQICCQETEITSLDLTAVDPVCGTIHIRLNPDRPSKGLICQTSPGNCFPAESCFDVFILADVNGKVYENCEPAVMCCKISALPPYDCVYLLNFGNLSLYPLGACDLPLAQRPPEAAQILAQSTHIPKPCPPASARCEVVNGHAQITVVADPNCPCDRFVVTRDDGVVIPASTVDPTLFIDPDRCTGPRTYTVRCAAGGALSDPITVRCPCEPQGCKVDAVTCTLGAGGVITATWSTKPAGCCVKLLVQVICDGVVTTSVSLPGTATSVVLNGCPVPCTKQEVCVRCVDTTGNVGPPVCCSVDCPPPSCGVLDLRCEKVRDAVGAAGVRLLWTLDPNCPCERVKILRDGVVVAIVPASDGAWFDPKDCPSNGPSVTHEYCVVCVDANGKEIGPKVCCKVICGGDPCQDRHIEGLKCESVGTPPTVVLTWSQNSACPCVKVRVSRDGLVIGEVDAAAGTFKDPCVPGDHIYCVVCIDASGAVVGERQCCTVVCPPPPTECDCPPGGVDKFESSLIHLIDVPGFGQIRADMKGPVVVRRSDPYVDQNTGLCCIKTRIEEMILTGSDPLAGPIKITLNPCLASEGTICQKAPGAKCFPALSCFDIYIRIELPALGLVLVNCDAIVMCCEIGAIPPFGCPYGIQNIPVALYKEVIDPAAPCRSICDLPAAQRPRPVAFIIEATHKPELPVVGCVCFPPAGSDTMDTNLWHEIIIPGIGTCRAALSGQVKVSRSDPRPDPATGRCVIQTEMVSMSLTGSDPTCGAITVNLNPRERSTGMISEKVPGSCFPADSFFDIFIEVRVDNGGQVSSFVNCEPAHMTAEITSIPPWNSFYNLDLEGLALYRLDPAQDVCIQVPRPASPASIGQALHVPRRTCDTCQYGPGTDTMDSTLSHHIHFLGLPVERLCESDFTGKVVVQRGAPYLDANDLCTVDTEMVELSLTANDPTCGQVTIHLNPDETSGGFIRALSKDACFPAKSCFKVFVEIEVPQFGLVLRNCEPAIMCCEISSIPPFGCVYQLNFGATVPLWKAADCKLPPSQRPPPVAEIIQIGHTPEPPCQVVCDRLNGVPAIRVIGDCRCQRIVVTRDDGLVIPPAATDPRLFIDRECKGTRTYTVTCIGSDGTSTVLGTCTYECATVIRGDANGDTVLDISDVVASVFCQFLGGECPRCTPVLDVNCDHVSDISDPVSLINYLYLGGKPPCSDPVECPTAVR